MPVVSRTTVTTTRTTGGGVQTFRSSSVPIWVIKLVSVIIAITILVLIYWTHAVTIQRNPATFVIVALTCGVLLGWSIGSVLQQVFNIRTVEILVNIILTILVILALVLVFTIVINKNVYYESDHKYMIGVTIILVVQTIVCLLMLSWAWYGNIVIIQSS